MENNQKQNSLEKILWSIAFPGFGQLLNGRMIKGIILIILEVIINLQSNFNKAILYSFYGEIDQAITITNYQWLMFYPCIYLFAIWDAYKDSGGGKSPFEFIPFVTSAYFVTVGLIYSSTLEIFGILMGPIWLPILFVGVGVTIGLIVRKILIMIFRKSKGT
ncbi:hypothetical protein [Gracilibacillus dipsosauri]|uniref:hypothetical protein n=1 Tax=Gracilibacillus dipsosauri TaxID=178340 RepID=UPI00240A033B